MPRFGKWETIRELGRGGQGVVYLAYNREAFDQEYVLDNIRHAINILNSTQYPEQYRAASAQLVELVEKYINRFHPSHLGAVKVLHSMGHSTDAEKVRERMIREIEALRRISHPHLLRILDAKLEENWFTCEHHERGPLSGHRDLFRGDMVASLRAFRTLVDAVAKLHEAGIVHRDIKPGNVFLALDGRLVLGDMGLVFFADEQRIRVSEAYENVGSRDWMPGWAYGMRLEEVRPTFDVFSLGKLFWSILSGRTLLPLWYWNKPDFNVERIFPGEPSIKSAKYIFEKSIVEEEKDCLPDARELRKIVDDLVATCVKRLCLVCGLGIYQRVAGPHEANRRDILFFGPAGMQGFFVFECNHCGHVQLFSFPGEKDDLPTAWRSASDG